MRDAVVSTPGRDFDWALALVAAIVGAAAFVLLWKGEPVRADSHAPAIATLRSALSDVRRRPSGTLVWERLSAGAVLSEGDSLFVPPASAATVLFRDGSQLELDENTLVALERPERGGPHAIRVEKGLVVGSTERAPLLLRTDDGDTVLQNGARARLEVATAGPPRIEVLQGTAKLGSGRKLSSPRWPITLTSPSALGRSFFSGTSPGAVAFEWTGTLPDGAQLQLIRLRAIEGPSIVTVPAEGNRTTVTPSSAGTYEWRLVGADGTALSETRRLWVVRDVPPRILSPRQNEVIAGYLGRQVPFAWTAVGGAQRYLLEVADGPDFANVVFRREVDATSLRVKWPQGEGRFVWRVRTWAPEERGDSPWSAPSTFRHLVKPLPDTPELIDSELEVEP